MVFTREELDEMYKSQLITLAEYYGLEANMRMLKGDIIDKILGYELVEEPQMSVRVKRIKELNQE